MSQTTLALMGSWEPRVADSGHGGTGHGETKARDGKHLRVSVDGSAFAYAMRPGLLVHSPESLMFSCEPVTATNPKLGSLVRRRPPPIEMPGMNNDAVH